MRNHVRKEIPWGAGSSTSRRLARAAGKLRKWSYFLPRTMRSLNMVYSISHPEDFILPLDYSLQVSLIPVEKSHSLDEKYLHMSRNPLTRKTFHSTLKVLVCCPTKLNAVSLKFPFHHVLNTNPTHPTDISSFPIFPTGCSVEVSTSSSVPSLPDSEAWLKKANSPFGNILLGKTLVAFLSHVAI